LRPYSRSIDVVGRDTILLDFQDWLANGRGISIRVLVGPAGRGKTRLALALCEQAAAVGWRAGILTSQELERFQDKQNAADWGWNAPTLVVMDYAASDAARLNAWLTELSDHASVDDADTGRDCPLRLLLLERHADPQAMGGWWQNAFGYGDGDAGAIQRLLDSPEPIVLPAMEGDEDRRSLMAAMLRRAGSDIQLPALGADAYFDGRLSTLTWGGEPLFLMMAALLASQQGFAVVLGLARDDLALAVAKKELARIGRIAKSRGVPAAFAGHMAALATLCRGLPEAGLLEVIGREKAALGHDGIDRAAALSAMAAALPRQGGGIDAVEPDMVGEAILLLAWQGNEGQQGTGVVRRAIEDARAAVIQVVIRTCQDYAIHSHAAPLIWLDALGADAAHDLPALLALLDELPLETLELRERAHALTGTAVAAFRQRLADDGGQADEAGLATSLHNLSNRLDALGRREETLAASEEAVAIRRELAAARPDAFRPDLAMSLSVRGDVLKSLERHGDAMASHADSLRTLTPDLLGLPQAFAQLSAQMSRGYLECAQAAGQEPDMELLAPIITKLLEIGAIELPDGAWPTSDEDGD